MNEKPLKPSHQRFVAEMVRGARARDAYLAGHPRSGRRAAAVSATRLLRNPRIQARIREGIEEEAAKSRPEKGPPDVRCPKNTRERKLRIGPESEGVSA